MRLFRAAEMPFAIKPGENKVTSQAEKAGLFHTLPAAKGYSPLLQDTFQLKFGSDTPVASPPLSGAPSYQRGMAGMVADLTRISDVDPKTVSLIYRGYDIRDLVNHSSFEETGYLLLNGKLPNADELSAYEKSLRSQRALTPDFIGKLKTMPKTAHPMDRLKAAVALLALEEDPKFLNDKSHGANVQKAITLTAKTATIVAALHRIDQGLEPIAPREDLSHAANFLYMLNGKEPDPTVTKAFDQVLICYADHGFNASTTAARVTASTLSDMYSAVASAIGTLKGPLHGGANEQVMRMLLEIGSPENAEPYIMNRLAQAKTDPEKNLMGFGHREYKNGDPRAKILIEMAQKVGETLGQPQWVALADKVREVMAREKPTLHPNVDYPIGYMFYMLGLPMEIYTPIFALARMVGWTSHVVELQDKNVLYRPKADYQGERGLTYLPLAERGNPT